MLIALALHLALTFQNSRSIPAAIVREAVAEATVIWAPYGVALHDDSSGLAVDDAKVLVIRITEQAARIEMAVPLGVITFGPDDMPEPRIIIFLDEVVRLVSLARVLGVDESHWPRRLREQIIGRVLGRVLAHEIGHYVLRSRQHSAFGLMRPEQRIDELTAESRVSFRLSVEEVAQLGALAALGSSLSRKENEQAHAAKP